MHAHIPFNEGLGLIGTPTFASIDSHLGLELGRRDDLESLAYTLFYFLWGFLPWQGLGFEGILKSKRQLTELNLFCELLLELHTFFEHCCTLPFNGKPNYDHISLLFDNLFVKEGFQGDVAFDWDITDTNIQEEVLKITGDVPLHEPSLSCKCCMW